MGEENLNIVLFGESDELLVQLVNVVHQMAPRSFIVGVDWDEFIDGLRQGPDIVILHLEAFFEVDPDIATRFAALFAALEIPVVVAMPIETSLDYRTEIITCFDGIIEPPVTSELFLRAIELVRAGLPSSEPLPLDEALSAVFADNIPTLNAPPAKSTPTEESPVVPDTQDASGFVTLTPEVVEISNARPWVPVDAVEVVEEEGPSLAKTTQPKEFGEIETRLERTETGPFAAVKENETPSTPQPELEPDFGVIETLLERTEQLPILYIGFLKPEVLNLSLLAVGDPRKMDVHIIQSLSAQPGLHLIKDAFEFRVGIAAAIAGMPMGKIYTRCQFLQLSTEFQ